MSRVLRAPGLAPTRSRRTRWAIGLALASLLVGPGATAHADTQVSGWGDGSNSALGESAAGPTFLPTVLGEVQDATGAAVGASRTFVVTPRGVLATGLANSGALGLGPDSPPQVTAFTLIPGTEGATRVATGVDATLVVQADGSVAAFGVNKYGGAGGTVGTAVVSPTTVAGLPSGVPITDVAAGTYASLALDADGGLWRWGGIDRSATGQTAAVAGDTVTPQRVEFPAPRKVEAIAAGTAHALALLDDGSVWAWGATNTSGQVGNGTTGSTVVAPVQVIAPPAIGQPRVASISAAATRSFAVLDDHSFRAWGSNPAGQLGLGAGNGLAVKTPTGPNPNGLTPFPAYPPLKRIAAGSLSTHAIGTDGRVYAWGRNDNGQLGSHALTYAYPFTGAAGASDGSQTATEIPQRVGVLKGVSWLAEGTAGTRQIVRTDQTLQFEGPSSFFTQPLGTLSATLALRVLSIGDPSTIKRAWISGRHARDFLYVGTQDDAVLPVTVPSGHGPTFEVRFAPSELGEREATLNVEADGERLAIPLDGFGVELPGNILGPPGINGTNGTNGVDGRPGADGAIGFAAARSRVTVRRGRTATLPFLVVNGTGSTLARTSLTASVPASLRSTGRRSVEVPAIGRGADRTVRLALEVGKRAKPGTRSVTVRLRVGTTTASRTVKVRVTR